MATGQLSQSEGCIEETLHETPREGTGILDAGLLRQHYNHGCSIVYRVAERLYGSTSALRDDVTVRNRSFDTDDDCLSYIDDWVPAGVWMDSNDIRWFIDYEIHTDDGIIRNQMVNPDLIIGSIMHLYATFDDPEHPYVVTIDASVYSQPGYTDAFVTPPTVTVESDD